MSIIKRLVPCLLAVAMVFVLAACGQQTAEQPGASTQAPETQTPDSSTDRPVQGHKTLVVYYSASGRTEEVAGYIADTLGGAIFELTPVEDYTSSDLDWTDETSRVSREHEDASLRTVELTADTVDNWQEYSTVFIGYPIWWGIAAWPVDGFVAANDFTGKTVIPFCTSASSDMGQSGELLAQLAGNGDWQEGQRFGSGVSETEVVDWVNSLMLTE